MQRNSDMETSKITQVAHFRFVGYLITKTNCKISKEIRGIESLDLNIDIEPYGKVLDSEKKLEVMLEVEVSERSDYVHMSFTIIGFFEYNEMGFEEVKPFICTNAPAIIFPYIRAYVSNLSALGGIPPLIMPTLNFAGVGKILLEKLMVERELDGDGGKVEED